MVGRGKWLPIPALPRTYLRGSTSATVLKARPAFIEAWCAGVLNLLPIPVLDGGHLLYYSIEAVIRRPVPERIQAWGLQLGLLLISGVMALAVYNDISRLL